MTFYLRRLFSNEEETIGILSFGNKTLCWTLEDEFRAIKVFSETRISAGTYELELRLYGSHHNRYKEKFPNIHKGMIELKDVPNFKDILIHIGNSEVDTSGCILVGSLAVIENNRYTILNSTKAYKFVYPIIANPLSAGEKIYMKIIDE